MVKGCTVDASSVTSSVIVSAKKHSQLTIFKLAAGKVYTSIFHDVVNIKCAMSFNVIALE